jgi:hypothetical protein
MAVYGPVRHQTNIIWTSEASVHIFFWWRTGPYTAIASVHIIFFWWRTGPYTAIWPSVPWTICYIVKLYTSFSGLSFFDCPFYNVYLHLKSQCTVVLKLIMRKNTVYIGWCTHMFLPHSWLIIGFVTKLTRQMPLVEQEMLTPPVFS